MYSVVTKAVSQLLKVLKTGPEENIDVKNVQKNFKNVKNVKKRDKNKKRL